MKHAVLTRINFDDKSLMEKYLKVSEKYFIPSLKSQTDQNFKLFVMCKGEDFEYLKKRLGYDFIRISGSVNFFDYCKENGFNIQTRHDCDDWMSPNYIEMIHKAYKDNIDKHDKFLVQSQPLRQMHPSGNISNIHKYHDRKCSMHLSLCQKIVNNHIYERQHAYMYEIASKVITLPGNPTRWIIHGENISVKRGSIKYNDRK